FDGKFAIPSNGGAGGPPGFGNVPGNGGGGGPPGFGNTGAPLGIDSVDPIGTYIFERYSRAFSLSYTDKSKMRLSISFSHTAFFCIAGTVNSISIAREIVSIFCALSISCAISCTVVACVLTG